MKKLLSVVLAAVMLFSVVAIAFTASAEVDPAIVAYTVTFVNEDDALIHKGVYPENFDLKYVAANWEPDSYKGEDGLNYYFIGWKSSTTGNVRTSDSLPFVRQDVTYTAVFEAEDNAGGQTLLQFIKSIFERMNTIFQYFWDIFFKDR